MVQRHHQFPEIIDPFCALWTFVGPPHLAGTKLVVGGYKGEYPIQAWAGKQVVSFAGLGPFHVLDASGGHRRCLLAGERIRTTEIHGTEGNQQTT